QSETGLSAAELFGRADQAIAAGQTQDAEALYRALARDPDIEVRSEARFRLGMMLDRLGRKRDAAVAFRALLDEKPGAARVRIELARVLTELGDETAARRELRQAQAGGLPPQVAQAVNQFSAALRSRKPLGASLEFALVPDSNINRATDSETLDTIIAPLELSRDARETSGIGARVGGQVYARQAIGKDLALLPRISGQGEFYRQGAFNDVSLSTQLGLEWSPGRHRLRPSVGVTNRWYGGRPYARTASATLNWQRPLGTRAQLDATAAVALTRYRLNDLQDGMLWNAGIAYERAFDARSGGSVRLSGTRQTARDPGYATASGGVDLLYWHELGKTSAYATLGGRRLEGDARLFLFPDRRREWTLNAGAGATFRALQLHGFAPLVRVEVERNWSTVGLYDYRRVAGTFGITRAF
ncbi:MAG TPA: surface lipoprotein assembly modifier, partial [Sphingomonas sp.]|nr:surface lipoprotein assembly modifier [Sphingomonas sp.]